MAYNSRTNNKYMENNQPVQKTWKDKAQESLLTAAMSAGIVLIVLLLLWIPFKLVPMVLGNSSNMVSTALSSMFISGDSNPAQNSNDTSVTASSSNKEQVVQVKKVYSGKPDLEISLISTGIIDPATKKYIQTNYGGYNDEIGIKFEVKNVGSNVSGSWKLRINAPSRTTPYFDSDNQVSIKPGDKIVFTATFDSPSAVGINTAYITIDPLGLIDESSKSNNSLQVPIKIDGTYYTLNYNYNYGSNSTVYNPGYGTMYSWSNLNVNCYASPQMAQIGTPVTWYSTVSGGNGYYSYAWTGSDQLYSNETAAVSKAYYSSGTKIASVTVSSGGQTITKQCSVNIF